MTCLRLYSPAIVLLTWAIVWGAGLTGDGVIFVGLLLTGIAVVLAEHTRMKLRQEREGALT